MTISSQDVYELLSEIDYPLYIVTVAVDGEKDGCLVGFVTQASVTPPRLLVCLSKKNHTYETANSADTFVVHLAAEENRELAELFGGETGDEIDKFEQCEWTPGPGGVPVLAGCDRWFGGRVVDKLDTGDHMAFLVEPTVIHNGGPVKSLTFQQAKDIDPGHEP